jgi:hypothetical protein
MATFSLTNTNGSAVVRLQPWTINEVVFKGVELKTGTTKDGGIWKAIQFKFAGNNGIFEPMFFCPKEGGDQRPSGETNGRKWEMPSQMEQLAFAIAHVVGVMAPANYEKLKKVSLNLPADFEKLVETVKKAMASAVNKSTNIKLIADNRGYAAVPNFININKESGEAYISNNWVGENLAFSAYEIKKMEAAKNAKPTAVEETSEDIAEDSSENDDLNFDI